MIDNETKKMSKTEFLDEMMIQKKTKVEPKVDKKYWNNFKKKNNTQKKYRW